jgi:hypothetical protein
MIDKHTSQRINNGMSGRSEEEDEDEEDLDQSETITDDELLLATPVLYGFRLNDKMWGKYISSLLISSSLAYPCHSAI